MQRWRWRPAASATTPGPTSCTWTPAACAAGDGSGDFVRRFPRSCASGECSFQCQVVAVDVGRKQHASVAFDDDRAVENDDRYRSRQLRRLTPAARHGLLYPRLGPLHLVGKHEPSKSHRAGDADAAMAEVAARTLEQRLDGCTV